MAYSELEQSYMDSIARAEFPGLFEPQGEPVQVAAAPGETMTDAAPAAAGSVPEMRSYDPTVRERLVTFVQSGFEGIGMERAQARRQAETLLGGPGSGIPMGMGVADLIPFLGTGLQTEEAARSMTSAAKLAKQGNYAEAAVEGGMGVLGLVPGAAGTAKAIKTVIKSGKKKATAAAAGAAAPSATANDTEQK